MPGSQLGVTRAALKKAENQCAEATLAIQQARSTAEDQANWAINMGVDAHHAVLQNVIDALNEAYEQFETAHSAAGASKGLLREVDDHSGREELAKQVGLSEAKFTEVVTAVTFGKAKLDDDANGHAQASQDENVLQAVNSAMAVAVEAHAAVDDAVKAVESYRAELTPGN